MNTQNEEEFIQKLTNDFGLPRESQCFKKAYALAYDERHSEGWQSVYDFFEQLMDIVAEGRAL